MGVLHFASELRLLLEYQHGYRGLMYGIDRRWIVDKGRETMADHALSQAANSPNIKKGLHN